MRKIVLLFISLIAFGISDAQLNYLQRGNKVIYFGIALGVNLGDYRVVRKPKLNALETDSILRVESKIGPGFNLGIIGNYQFHKYFDLRLVPTLSFSDKHLDFTEISGNVVRKTVPSIYLHMPLTLRYKAKPINDFRFFVLAGIRYDFDLNANSNKRNNENQILVSRHDLGVEFGVGFQIFFPTFIMSPEIKIGHSVINVKEPNEGLIYSRTIDKLFSRTLTITINLEG